MRTIFNLRRYNPLKRAGVLLIVVALVAGIIGCVPTDTYELTMAVNPAGSGTATDVTGTSPYASGTVVNITAVAAQCYRFVNWSAPAGTFADANAADTTFTMPAQDVTVTANFEAVPADHFKFYTVAFETAPEVGKDVQLVDQFGSFDALVGDAVLFGNPVEKVHGEVQTPISDPDRHYTLYELLYEEAPQSWQVTVKNQFGNDQELTVIGPVALAVPTQKGDHEAPECLDHLLVYEVLYEPFPEVSVLLTDQFKEENVVVWEPVLFANPVEKTVLGSADATEIQNPDDHYVWYRIEGEPIEKTVPINNQFGDQVLDLTYADTLAVPSEKVAWEQPLNHFNVYWAEWAAEPPATFPAEVQLEDQFGAITANVTFPELFANPVNKWYGDDWTPISNPHNHLTFYNLAYEVTTPTWYVQIDNQLGLDQELWVQGPIMLAVPTKKGLHDPPQGLDHFLVYEVVDSANTPVEVVVGLKDQWIDQPAVDVGLPILFANPVQKIHGDQVTDIQNPDDHLLFYWTDGGTYCAYELPIENQFGPQLIDACEEEFGSDLLGVPSLKVEWTAVL